MRITKNRAFKGIWIPREIWLMEELSAVEKTLLAEIDSLDNQGGCFASNGYLADFLHVSESTISRGIAKLEQMGLVERKGYRNRMRILTVTVHYARLAHPNQNDEGEQMRADLMGDPRQSDESSVGNLISEPCQFDDHSNIRLFQRIRRSLFSKQRRFREKGAAGGS